MSCQFWKILKGTELLMVSLKEFGALVGFKTTKWETKMLTKI